MTILDDLMKDVGNSGIIYDEPLPMKGDDQDTYRVALQMDIENTKREFGRACMEYATRPDKRLGFWKEREIESLKRRLWKLNGLVKIFVGAKEGISPERVAQARSYPIKELIKTFHGMAKCPFHPDKRPSMDTRNNFYYCYGCGATGDVIDWVMKIENLTFTQAITRLT